jgi:hypothetical protein
MLGKCCTTTFPTHYNILRESQEYKNKKEKYQRLSLQKTTKPQRTKLREDKGIKDLENREQFKKW